MTLGSVGVAVLTVLPSDSPPVRFKRRIWVRVGPRRAIATSQEESILNERRRYRDRPLLKHFRSLMPLAQESREPMSALRAADGAISSHAQAVQEWDRDFRALAREIAKRTGMALP